MLTVPAVTENVVEVNPCGTVTDAGTVAAEEDALSVTIAPPLGAADVSATLQMDPANEVSDVGLHEMLLNTGVWRIVTVPPLTEVGIEAPVEPADRPPASWIDDEVSGVESAKVSVREATTLLGRVSELSPQTRQVAVPIPLLQERDLSEASDPSAKEADVKSVVE
jgi:hypothetical protein